MISKSNAIIAYNNCIVYSIYFDGISVDIDFIALSYNYFF